MTKTTLTTFAAALLAGTVLSTAAQAGGLRVGFGFPLGSFIAHSLQSQAGRPSYQHVEKKQSAKPVVARRKSDDDDAPARKVHRPAPKKVEVAQEEPAPRKVKRAPKVQVAAEEEAPAPRKIKRAPKVEVAQQEAPAPRKIKRAAPKIEVQEQPEAKQAEVKTASLENKAVLSDVTPSTVLPAATAQALEIKGTQATPSTIQTAMIEPEKVKTETVTADTSIEPQPAPAKTETSEKVEEKSTTVSVALPANPQKLCRRFSAAVAALIDVPCE